MRFGLSSRQAPAPRRHVRSAPQVQPLEDRWLLSTIIDLGAYVSPAAINTSGQVAGDVLSSGQTHAFLYSNGTLADLGTVAGFTNSHATALNNSGKVVGSLDNGPGSVQHAMLYNGQTMTDRGTAPGYTDGVATGINDVAQAIGYADTAPGSLNDEGFLYSQGTLTDLGSSISLFYPAAINDAGQVAFGSHLITGGQTTLLPNSAGARALNAPGQVAGSAAISRDSNPFIWTPTVPNGTTGTEQLLFNLPGDNAGTAYGINAAGQAVGTCNNIFIPQSNQPFLYSDSTMMNLNDLLPGGSGWNLQTATAINDAGQVVGTGYLNGDTSVLHGFLLDLNDAPATHAAGAVAADTPALAQVTAPAATQLGTALDQAPAAASLERRHQPTSATVAAPASTRLGPAMDSPLVRPVSPTPAALDQVSAVALDVAL
jgi:probable HAF family extracellular repeat protein